MKKIALTFAALPVLISCSSGNSSSNSTTPLINISSVTVGKMAGDSQASQFSTIIKFTNGNNKLSNWQFGFYMPRSFDTVVTTQQSVNPDLLMQICIENSTSCANLKYQTTSSITSQDLSAGYTTVLAPEGSFILESGVNYVVNLLHNNQWNAGNYSAVPQNFFITSGSQVSNIPTTTTTYQLLDYAATAVNTQINQHINTIWANSNSFSESINLIPSPVAYVAGTGSYTLQSGIVIHNELNTDNTVANFYRDDLAKDLGISATVDNQPNVTSGIVIKQLSDASLIANNPEGYQIAIGNGVIYVYALNNTGVLYALQSLRQLWNQNSTLAAATITDYPRFKYRGVLLDTARHFFSVAEIKILIDLALVHKINTLHMHFADDEGTRIGLAAYPSIKSVADVRGYPNSITALMFIQGNLDITNFNDLTYPQYNTTYTGTYSLNDLAELVSYANKRGITIIPEIDTPGHARSLIKAFPDELVDPNDKSDFISVQGYTDDVLPVCTYNSTTSVGPKFTTLFDNIFNQAATIFNNQSTLYAINNEISVGGDEVSSGAWTNDSSCSGQWASLSALGKSQLFFQMFAAKNPNLKISGWQQYIQTDETALGQNVVPAAQAGHVWIWNTSTGGIPQAKVLAESGYPVVLDYADETYFDLAYNPAITEPGFTWATGFSDTQAALMSAVSATQTVNQIAPAYQQNILGLEGTLWAENLATYDHMIYMALPKMAGLAEAGWSPASITDINNQVNWQSLSTRLGCGQTGFLAYLNKLFAMHYRGYPNGIALEVPSSSCPKN